MWPTPPSFSNPHPDADSRRLRRPLSARQKAGRQDEPWCRVHCATPILAFDRLSVAAALAGFSWARSHVAGHLPIILGGCTVAVRGTSLMAALDPAQIGRFFFITTIRNNHSHTSPAIEHVKQIRSRAWPRIKLQFPSWAPTMAQATAGDCLLCSDSSPAPSWALPGTVPPFFVPSVRRWQLTGRRPRLLQQGRNKWPELQDAGRLHRWRPLGFRDHCRGWSGGRRLSLEPAPPSLVSRGIPTASVSLQHVARRGVAVWALAARQYGHPPSGLTVPPSATSCPMVPGHSVSVHFQGP